MKKIENRSLGRRRVALPRRSEMRTPEDVAAMLRLHAQGWGSKRIAEELGIARNTVRRHLRQGGYRPYAVPRRARALDGLEDWLQKRFRQHGGNADVVRQELLSERKIDVSLRTVERAVEPYRRELAAEARATTRFETAPGKQLQIDFGTATTAIGGEQVRVKLFVATLGFSRRIFVKAFDHERQSAWFEGIEAAFRHFGGVTDEVLLDNARALVSRHNPATREVVFNDRLRAFAAHWGFVPVACAPYRARTKGKDERAVGYVKRNAVAGRHFVSWQAFEAHLQAWIRDVADQRIHGTTGQRPAERFAREAEALAPCAGKPTFLAVREVRRRVQNDLSVELDTNRYSVPWRLIGAEVTVQQSAGVVTIFHAGEEVARHLQARGRRQRVVDRQHLEGVSQPASSAAADVQQAELLRPLSVYEQLVEEAS